MYYITRDELAEILAQHKRSILRDVINLLYSKMKASWKTYV